jgi:chromosome segregation ATPase
MSGAKSDAGCEELLAPPGRMWPALLIGTGAIALGFLSVGMFGHYRLLQSKEQWAGQIAQRETQMRFLQEQATKLAAATEKSRAEAEAAEAESARIKGETAVVRMDLGKHTQKLTSLKSAYDQLDADLQTATQKRNRAAQQYAGLTNDIVTAMSRIAELDPRRKMLEETVPQLAARQQAIAGELAAARGRLTELETVVQQCEKDVNTRRSQLQKLNADIQESLTALNAAKAAAAKATATANTIEDLAAEKAGLDATLSALNRDRQESERRQATLAAVIKQQQAQRQALENEIAALATRRSSVAATQGVLDAQNSAMTATLGAATNRSTLLHAQIDVLQSQKADLERAVAELDAKRAATNFDVAQLALARAEVVQLAQRKAQLNADVKATQERLDALTTKAAEAQTLLSRIQGNLAGLRKEAANPTVSTTTHDTTPTR